MAEAAMLPETPWHLRELQNEARWQTDRFFRDRPMDRDTGEFYARAYLALRVQAYQRSMRPLYAMAARAQAMMLPGPITIDQNGMIHVEPMKLPESTQAVLDEAAAFYRRHYDLEPAR